MVLLSAKGTGTTMMCQQDISTSKSFHFISFLFLFHYSNLQFILFHAQKIYKKNGIKICGHYILKIYSS